MYIKSDDPVKQEYFDYLEELRQSGDTNMYGAASYLEREFPELRGDRSFHSSDEARAILQEWMEAHAA